MKFNPGGFVKQMFGSVVRFFKDPKHLAQAADITAKAAQIVGIISVICPVGGVSLRAVLAVYHHFGVPVTEALADGKLDATELKLFLQKAAVCVMKDTFGLSTSQATIVIESAYDELKADMKAKR